LLLLFFKVIKYNISNSVEVWERSYISRRE